MRNCDRSISHTHLKSVILLYHSIKGLSQLLVDPDCIQSLLALSLSAEDFGVAHQHFTNPRLMISQRTRNFTGCCRPTICEERSNPGAQRGFPAPVHARFVAVQVAANVARSASGDEVGRDVFPASGTRHPVIDLQDDTGCMLAAVLAGKVVPFQDCPTEGIGPLGAVHVT